MRSLGRALLLVAALAARALADEPPAVEPNVREPAVEAVPLPPWVGRAWYGANPSLGTRIAGLSMEQGRIQFEAEVARLREPGADPSHFGVLQGAMAYRWELGRAPLRVRTEAVLGLWVGAAGDVVFGVPELGGGLLLEWPFAPHLVAVGTVRLTVPIPLLESRAGLRLELGRFGLAAGWHDLRFLPVFGLPDRAASVPEAVLSLRF